MDEETTEEGTQTTDQEAYDHILEELKILIEKKNHYNTLSFTGFYLSIIFLGVFINIIINLMSSDSVYLLPTISMISSVVILGIVNWMSSIDQSSHGLIPRIRELEDQLETEHNISFSYRESIARDGDVIRYTRDDKSGEIKRVTADSEEHSEMKKTYLQMMKYAESLTISKVAPLVVFVCLAWFVVSLIWATVIFV